MRIGNAPISPARRQAVRDGDFVTANGSAALAFAREVLPALSVAPEEDISQGYAFHQAGLTPVNKLTIDFTFWAKDGILGKQAKGKGVFPCFKSWSPSSR